MNKVLLHEIVMPNYIRKVKLSDKRRTHYLELKDKFIDDNYRELTTIHKVVRDNLSTIGTSKPLGKSMQRGLISGEYIFKERVKKKPLCLFDTKTNEFVVTNPRTAGTEKWEVINGNYIYNGKYHIYVQGKIMEEIHIFLSYFLEGINSITKKPLYIECEIHDWANDPISGEHWDVINRGFPYCKAFDDVLQELKIIPEDTNNIVRCPTHPIFYPLEEYPSYTSLLGVGYGNIPLLVFKIYHIC